MTTPARDGAASDGWGESGGTVTWIRSDGDAQAVDLGELLRHRELLHFLVWKDVLVRYKQTLLGVVWVLLQPTLALVVFSLVFGRLARMPSDGIPYTAFAFAGVVPWLYFSRTLLASPASLVSNPNLIRKVYFPRLLLPASVVASGVLDLLLGLALLVVLIPAYDLAVTPRLLALPLLVAWLATTALGTSLWLSALNARYRDVGALIPFATQIWMFASPVVYPASLIPPVWQTLYALNPLVGIIGGFRWCLLSAPAPAALASCVSAATSVALLAGGLLYFKRSEPSFADVL